MKRIVLLALAVLLAAPQSASACLIGQEMHLFQEAPPPHPFGWAEVRGQFTNFGPDYDLVAARERSLAEPSYPHLQLIGIIKTAKRTLPVYASVTDCSSFFSQAAKYDGKFTVVGRLDKRDGDPAFVAASLYAMGSIRRGSWTLPR